MEANEQKIQNDEEDDEAIMWPTQTNRNMSNRNQSTPPKMEVVIQKNRSSSHIKNQSEYNNTGSHDRNRDEGEMKSQFKKNGQTRYY